MMGQREGEVWMDVLYYVRCYFELVDDAWIMRHAESLDYSGNHLNKEEEGFGEPSWVVDKKPRIETLWSMRKGVKLLRANLDWPSSVESYNMEEAVIENPSSLYRWGQIENEVVKEAKKRIAKGSPQ